MRVLKDNGWAGKLHFVGFDSSDNLVKGLQDGTLDGLVLQDPVKMGYLAIKTLVAHIKGQPVERRIDTGVQRRHAREHGPAGDQIAAASGSREMNAAAMSAAPRFAMRGIRKAFGATVALDGVDLSVARRRNLRPDRPERRRQEHADERSSPARCAPDAGELSIDGQPFAPHSPIDARRAGVAMIYQELSLAPHLSVMENILLGAEPMRYGLSTAPRMREMAARALAQLGHDDIPPDARVGTLSVAAQQLVEIARAIAVGCRVLVLDEPTSSLGRADVRAPVRAAAPSEGAGARHRLHLALHRRSEERRRPLHRAARRPQRRRRRDRRTPRTTLSSALMVGTRAGRSLSAHAAHAGRGASSKSSGLEPGFGVVHAASRRDPRHRRPARLGPHAAAAHAVRARAGAKRGRVRVGVYSGGRARPHERWRAGHGPARARIARAKGSRSALSVADNLTLTQARAVRPGVRCVSPRARSGRRALDRRARRSSAPGPRQPAGELSGGNQQKIAIARLLHHDVDVLVLDEPTRGIDVGSKAQIYRLIDELSPTARRPAGRAKRS